MKTANLLFSVLVMGGLSLSVVSGFSGCAKSKNDSSQLGQDQQKGDPSAQGGGGAGTPGTNGKIPSFSEEQKAKLVSEGQVLCTDKENPSACPPAVGMFLAVGENSIPQCTAFLVNNGETLATSSHCIPDDLKKEGAVCTDRIKVMFPAVGNLPSTEAKCLEVLSASQVEAINGQLSPDFAFIRLDRVVPRDFFVVDQHGFREGQVLRVSEMISTTPLHLMGEIRTKICTAVQNSFALPQFDNDSTQVVTLTCPVAYSYGNAGAPIIDENDTVRGIVHAPVDASETWNLKLQGRLSEPMAKMVYATNFACVNPNPKDKNALAVPGGCQADLSQLAVNNLRERPFRVAVPKAQKEVDETHKTWNGTHSSKISWVASSQVVAPGEPNAPLFIYPVPSCISGPTDKWIEEYAVRKFWTFWKKSYESSATLDFELPQWEPQFEFNANLQPVHKIKLAKGKATVTFSPLDIFKKKTTHVTVRFDSGSADTTLPPLELDLKMCESKAADPAPAAPATKK